MRLVALVRLRSTAFVDTLRRAAISLVVRDSSILSSRHSVSRGGKDRMRSLISQVVSWLIICSSTEICPAEE